MFPFFFLVRVIFSLNGGDSGGRGRGWRGGVSLRCLPFLSSVQWQPITEAFHPGGGFKWSDRRPLLVKARRVKPAAGGNTAARSSPF